MSSTTPTVAVAATPTVISATKAAAYLIATALFALAVYYIVGVEQGAVSVFGNDAHVHEFLHDARHFLGFPCH